jgi:O-antigen biosynthesis protein
MRVALLSYNARAHDAIGNHLAETVAVFLERGSAVRVFVQSADGLHPALRDCTEPVDTAEAQGPTWDYLAGADLVIAQFAQACTLLNFLPLLAGGKPRLLLDYHGVTPPALWTGVQREALEQGERQRGLVWCVDEAIAHSEFTRQELLTATGFPPERVHNLPLVVDRQRFQPGDSVFLHRRLGLADATFMLYVGRLAGNKRVPVLVEALTHLPANVHAAVIGDDGDLYSVEAGRCRARARELNVADRLHLLGQVGDGELADAYRSADMLVMPSLHEGFCIPVVEAMASGLPVIASRSAALPETVADAGLTFAPDDAEDLARQVQRVIAADADADKGGRIAVVCFRFGGDIVGGAETSLRTIARTLQSAGYRVEVFTTCTKSESDWRDELPAGTTTCDGLTVHRFPIDAHDREAHLEAVRGIVEGHGQATPEQEDAYLRHSIHSAALLQALENRAGEFAAIVAGPYLFGLTCDVARAFPERTLLLPCFHDEPIARMKVWPKIYGGVGGMLLHSPEEKELTLGRLGINCPNAVEIGTAIDMRSAQAEVHPRPYLVYCGRYSRQKNLPLLLDWLRRYQQERPGRFDLLLLGQGEVTLPRAPWLHNLGRVTEDRKRAVLAGAAALVQLSQQESLSLVALEAWAQQTPVIVHAGCPVLAGQIQRSAGGLAVGDYTAFADALDELATKPDLWRERGARGHAYVQARYGSREQFRTRLVDAVQTLDVPLRERMRQRGLHRATLCDRPAWRDALGLTVDGLLDAEPRPYRPALTLRPLSDENRAAGDTRTTLIPVRVHNEGTHAAVADGPGRTVLFAEVRDAETGAVVCLCTPTELPSLLLPGAVQTAMLLVPVPIQPAAYDLFLWAEHPDGPRRLASEPTCTRLLVGPTSANVSGLFPLLDGVRGLLIEAHRMQRLPDDYLDVSQGWLARWKRWTKKTLLNNFKRAYVDVLSRQQSQLNQQLVAAVAQLAECCATLDHAARSQQSRLDRLEAAADNRHWEADALRAEVCDGSDA